MKNKKFFTTENITPRGEVKVYIFLYESNEKILLNFFLSNYKISRIFKGKFFIKRLIAKIFKYKIHQKFLWDNYFWDKIIIHKMVSKIDFPIDMIDFKTTIKHKMISKRFEHIKKYEKLIKGKNKLGSPLYITGKAINFLGAKVNEKNIYILDGSRRLVANILCKVNPEILLIDIDE